ncbi:hypothetical protein GTO91_03545 [Heliobacterium undosum]|uniref:Polysaccharide biosynthesis protein C-terminal domain-containing protein n=1 Tax=Heliomicrobium undosum TaxID=121734 RepID=A0A845KY95_9FIRM|nr:hypothetical protein [Heliomicrobium undosum]MZP28782.1 hypothetical protein [Heliomicrobium undosum]
MKREWAKGAALALLEQALFSGSNFLFGILLARWLSADLYGAFVLASALFLFLAGIHNALILEPMSVIGPSRHREHLGEYFSLQLRAHFLITLIIAFFVATIGFLFHRALPGNTLLPVIITAGLTLPMTLYYWTYRRQMYISGQIAYAVAGNMLYAGFSLTAVTILHECELLSPALAFLIMGIAGVIAGSLLLVKKDRRRRATGMIGWADLHSTLRENWIFGRWILGSSLLSFGSSQAQTMMLGFWAGAEAAGALQAMMNFILPMMQTVTAASTLMLPALSRDFGEGKLAQLRSKGLSMMLLLTAAGIAYMLLLWTFSDFLVGLVYRGRYAEYVRLVPVVGFVPVITAAAAAYSIILRAIHRPELHFVTNAFQAAAGLLTSLFLISRWGVAGAAYSIVMTYLTAAFMTYILYRKALLVLNEEKVAERTE